MNMNNVVTRSLWLLVISTAIVLLSVAFLQPETTHNNGHSDSTLQDRDHPAGAEHEKP